MQALRGGLSSRCDFSHWRFQLLGLLHAQLPGVHGRLYRLDRTGGREQECRRLSASSERSRIRLPVAKPLVGANYKAAYCLSVCPAGEDVIGPYLADKQTHLKENVRPHQEKAE